MAVVLRVLPVVVGWCGYALRFHLPKVLMFVSEISAWLAVVAASIRKLWVLKSQ